MLVAAFLLDFYSVWFLRASLYILGEGWLTRSRFISRRVCLRLPVSSKLVLCAALLLMPVLFALVASSSSPPDRTQALPVGNDSVPIQLAQCRFPGWPFPTLKYQYIFQINYTEAILSNSTRLVAWHSGKTSVCGRRTFPVLRSTCS